MKIAKIGINVRYDTRAGIDYARLICCGKKTIETRENARSLSPYIGQIVGIIRTGKGPATLLGYATITGIKEYRTAEDFNEDYNRHNVPAGSAFSFDNSKTGKKFGFILEDA